MVDITCSDFSMIMLHCMDCCYLHLPSLSQSITFIRSRVQNIFFNSEENNIFNPYKFMTVKCRFFSDIEKMIGRMNIVAKVYFSMMWFVGSPVMILFIGKF